MLPYEHKNRQMHKDRAILLDFSQKTGSVEQSNAVMHSERENLPD